MRSKRPGDGLPLIDPIAHELTRVCKDLDAGKAPILELVSEKTRDLLVWWFSTAHQDRRAINFHAGQRQAILAAIYAHEVLGAPTPKKLYELLAPMELASRSDLVRELDKARNAHAKYCLKMATGTGKTWVLQALLIWQYLNALQGGQKTGGVLFTKNFLLVAPGLIVYDRLLDALLGKERDGRRDFQESDISRYGALFIPEIYRDEVFGFVQNSVARKEEIGGKPSGGGLIAVTNWHLLAGLDDVEAEGEIVDAGRGVDPQAAVRGVFPVRPGRAAGNDLGQLDQAYTRGTELEYLAGLPDLAVFNDEAHHIHELRTSEEITEVEWQKSLNRIAVGKRGKFVQIDFSATPYDQVGAGARSAKVMFPHIIVDFDLVEAMRSGLVKSLVLDQRRELAAEALDFKAKRDENGHVIDLSDGQRLMLRAGLTKLKKLESEFNALDASMRPKMMVVCEDTSVTSHVARFLAQEGVAEDEILTIDSGKKAELSQEAWAAVRESLFDMDARDKPRVVVSVLMLREGFDVNNICVIVPLRSSERPILLEQIIGRGLRLMWREKAYDEIKAENRARIATGQEPKSLIDVLSIVEHPAFLNFYDELMNQGLVVRSFDQGGGKSTGDLIQVDIRADCAAFDFAIPFVFQDQEEALVAREISLESLSPCNVLGGWKRLKGVIGKGEQFDSHDALTRKVFGGYRVDGGAMTASGYNEYLGRLVERVTQHMGGAMPGRSGAKPMPYLRLNKPCLAALADRYILERLFGEAFDPMDDENWRLLLLGTVLDHIVQELVQALERSYSETVVSDPMVEHRRLSEIQSLTMRESYSLNVSRCIYPRLPYPSHAGLLERRFIEWAESDAGILSFCKIIEHRHLFMRVRYLREDGLPGFYCPDFMARTTDAIYLVETKGDEQTSHPNVQRKKRSAITRCEAINVLRPEDRDRREWRYALISESLLDQWRANGARLAQLLEYAYLRHDRKSVQEKLF